jgi:hypothetical protein
MRSTINTNQMPGLAAGILLGLAIACLARYEPAYATTSDRATHFSMMTVPVTDAAKGIVDPLDGVFVLDFTTGQLKGAVVNRQAGKFASFYFRDLAKDFNVKPNQVPEFCLVNGYAQIPIQGGWKMASGMIYVSELASGKVAGYCFPLQEQGLGAPGQLIPMDVFNWQQAAKGK